MSEMASPLKLTETVVFQIESECEELISTEVVSVSLSSFPNTFDEVKEAIEISFSVPSFVSTESVGSLSEDRQPLS